MSKRMMLVAAAMLAAVCMARAEEPDPNAPALERPAMEPRATDVASLPDPSWVIELQKQARESGAPVAVQVGADGAMLVLDAAAMATKTPSDVSATAVTTEDGQKEEGLSGWQWAGIGLGAVATGFAVDRVCDNNDWLWHHKSDTAPAAAPPAATAGAASAGTPGNTGQQFGISTGNNSPVTITINSPPETPAATTPAAGG